MTLKLALAQVALATVAFGATVALPTHLGPTNFDTTAFPNTLVGGSFSSTSLTFGSVGPALTFGPFAVAAVIPEVTGSDLKRGLALGQGPVVGVPDFLIPGFGDISILNGPGADLVVFEAGSPSEEFKLAVSLDGGITFSANMNYFTFASVPLDASSGFNTNTAFIDLTDFGILAGQRVDALRLEGLFTGIGGSGPDILAIGVLNFGPPTGRVPPSVPEPSTWAMLALGGGAIAFLRRRG